MSGSGTVTGLAAATNTVLDAVHVDDWGNVSAVVSSPAFTTAAGAFALDDFNRENEQADASADWATLSGSSDGTCTNVVNGELVYTRNAAGFNSLIHQPAVPDDLSVEVRITGQSGCEGLILLRDTSADHANRSRYEIGFVGTTHIRIGKRLPTFTTLAENTSWVMPAFPFTMKAEAIGSALKLYIDGVEVLSTTDADLTTGKAGLGFFAASGPANVDLDDFTVEDLTP
jgi:hypothetical protein